MNEWGVENSFPSVDPQFSQGRIWKPTGFKLFLFLFDKLSHSLILLFQTVKHDSAAVDRSIECLFTVRGIWILLSSCGSKWVVVRVCHDCEIKRFLHLLGLLLSLWRSYRTRVLLVFYGRLVPVFSNSLLIRYWHILLKNCIKRRHFIESILFSCLEYKI